MSSRAARRPREKPAKAKSAPRKGTAVASASPRAHAIELLHVEDCFVRDVASYASPAAPVAGAHLRSGGVYVVGSKRVTVADVTMAHAQNHGDGGAGYGGDGYGGE